MSVFKMSRIVCDGPMIEGYWDGCPDGPRTWEGDGTMTMVRADANRIGWIVESTGNMNGDSMQWDVCPTCVKRRNQTKEK